MATKKTNHNDLFFVSLLVLVIVTAVVIMFANNQSQTQVQAEVESASVESTQELMNQLQNTVDDAGKADFVKLKNDSSGL